MKKTTKMLTIQAMLAAIYAAVTYSLFVRSDITKMYDGSSKHTVMLIALLGLGYVLPLFILQIPRFVMERDFEGQVTQVEYKRILKASAGLSYPARFGFAKNDILILVRAKVRFASGEEEWCNIRAYETDDPCVDNLVVGNYVRHYKWCKYTQIIFPEFRHDCDCVLCGMYTDKKFDRCQKCGEPLIKNEDVYI